MKILSKQRLISLLLLLAITPMGFLTKFYSGPAEEWINNSLGGLLYEIFWCLLFFFIFPKTKPIIIVLWIFIVTCLLEFMQLWHPPFLEYARNNFIGRTILGNSFNWMDFPYYLAGSFLGYLLLVWMNNVCNQNFNRHT